MSQAAHDEDPGFLVSAAATLRLILGWAFVALAGLDLAMGLDGVAYVMFHVVVLLTGLVLLGADRVGGRPSRFAWLTGASVAGAGLVVSTIPVLLVECCSSGYAVRHGFPFTMLARDPGGWRSDLYRTVADLLFWACAGLLVTVVAARVRPARDDPPPPSPGHAEPRDTSDVADDSSSVADPRNVGGLP